MTNTTTTTAPQLKLSKLIYGTWRLCDTAVPTPPADLLARLERCVELGITSFDLADIYGGGAHQSEKLFGQALALRPELRQQMQLISKCNIRFPNEHQPGVWVKHYDSSREYMQRRVDETLAAVGVDSLDLLLLHRPDCLMDADEVAETMNLLRDSGKVLHFGVSNFTASQMRLLQSRLSFPLVTNQIEMSVMCMEPMHDGTLDYMQEHRMKPMIWSPLAGGKIFDQSNEVVKPLRDALQLVAKKHGPSVTIDQVALAWLLRHPAGCMPIIGTNDLKRIESAVGALDLHLDRQQWFSIWTASAGRNVP